MTQHFNDIACGPMLRPAMSEAGCTSNPARVLVLFGADWDDRILPRYATSGRYRFHEHGFDLFSFPSNARLMWFDLWQFVDAMVRRYRGRIDAVFSSNEQFGALAAALVAERLELPGQTRRCCCEPNTSTKRVCACASLRPNCARNLS